MISLLLGLSLLFELAVVLTRIGWRHRRSLLVLATSTLGVSAGGLLVRHGLTILSLTFCLVVVYRLINLLRIAKGRAHEDHLYFAGRRTSLILAALILALYSVWLFDLNLRLGDFLTQLAAIQLLGAATLLGVSLRNLIKTKHRTSAEHYSDKELPTVTVALPARNETADLASCLESIIANDYPKLEVLVLDDCSQDRTAEIVKDFAQDGVRFIKGHEPKNGWLAKNQAYQQLLDNASGELILFCGVDVRMGHGAIRTLVTTLKHKQREMISVLPFRIGGGVRTAFIQPMRYWWELALPRRLFNRPPVLSTCWIINRRTMKKLGGMAAVSQSIIPERYFARELIKSDDYAFVRADESLDVRTTKGVEAQLETAVRMRYPQLRRQPENVLALSLFEPAMLVLPFLFLAFGFTNGFDLRAWLSVATVAMLVTVHYIILAASNPANSIVAVFNFPMVVLTEIVLAHLSMYKYEFGQLDWRGRNVCLPVMKVIPRLPKV